MGHRTAEVALGVLILGLTGTVSASEPDPMERATLRALVVDEAGIRPEVLRAAEDDAAAIYSAAGVQLVWTDATSGAHEPFDVTVKIASGMKPSMVPPNVSDLSLGFAAVNPKVKGRRGRLVWVLFDQLELHAQRRHVQISRLCGLVMAHEIGHLLLPAGHSETGLMRGTWDLRGGLLAYFDEPQVREIRGILGSVQLR